jgi:acyl-CoA dehydrogenase
VGPDLERCSSLTLWEGDRVFLPWLDRDGHFQRRLRYRAGRLVGHEVASSYGGPTAAPVGVAGAGARGAGAAGAVGGGVVASRRWRPMDFALPDELLALQRAVRDFAQREIAPIAAELDRDPRFPWPTLRKMGEMGLLGILTPEAYGGLGLDHLAYAVLLEEIAAADAAHATIASVTNGMPQALWSPTAAGPSASAGCRASRAARDRRVLPHRGARRQRRRRLRTRAERVDGGYRLERQQGLDHLGGRGAALPRPRQDRSSTPAPAGSRPSCSRRGRGAHVRRARAQARASTPPITTSLRFDGAFVPDDQRLGPEGQGFVMAMAALDGGRVGIAAQSLGIARRPSRRPPATRTSARPSAGRSASSRGWVQAGRHGDPHRRRPAPDAARRLAARPRGARHQGGEHGQAERLRSRRLRLRRRVQVFGGYGYSADYPVERYLRDARVTTLYEGTSEIQRIVISRQIHREHAR